MISGKSLFRRSPIDLEVDGSTGLWVDQPFSVRLLVRNIPDLTTVTVDEVQTIWTSSIPYLQVSYQLILDGRVVPTTLLGETACQLNNPNIVFSLTDEEKAASLLSLVYETSISVDPQYIDKDLQLEISMAYLNDGESTGKSTSDVERNIRMLMGLNRLGQSLDSTRFNQLHLPDQTIQRTITKTLRVMHPLRVSVLCRELNTNSSLISVTLQNIDPTHTMATDQVYLNLDQSVMNLDRTWESILTVHKTFVTQWKQHLLSIARATNQDTTLFADVDDSELYETLLNLEESVLGAGDTYSSVDGGASTIAHALPPALPSNLAHYAATAPKPIAPGHSSLSGLQAMDAGRSPRASNGRHRKFQSPFHVTSITQQRAFLLSPGQGKSIIYRVDRRHAAASLVPPDVDAEATAGTLLTTFYAHLSSVLSLVWSPVAQASPSSSSSSPPKQLIPSGKTLRKTVGAHGLALSSTSSTATSSSHRKLDYVAAVLQQVVDWSLGCDHASRGLSSGITGGSWLLDTRGGLEGVYGQLFQHLYGLGQGQVAALLSGDQLKTIASLLDVRRQIEVLQQVQRLLVQKVALPQYQTVNLNGSAALDIQQQQQQQHRGGSAGQNFHSNSLATNHQKHHGNGSPSPLEFPGKTVDTAHSVLLLTVEAPTVLHPPSSRSGKEPTSFAVTVWLSNADATCYLRDVVLCTDPTLLDTMVYGTDDAPPQQQSLGSDPLQSTAPSQLGSNNSNDKDKGRGDGHVKDDNVLSNALRMQAEAKALAMEIEARAVAAAAQRVERHLQSTYQQLQAPIVFSPSIVRVGYVCDVFV